VKNNNAMRDFEKAESLFNDMKNSTKCESKADEIVKKKSSTSAAGGIKFEVNRGESKRNSNINEKDTTADVDSSPQNSPTKNKRLNSAPSIKSPIKLDDCDKESIAANSS
jgi:pentatricopeptide repeat protein